MNEAAGVPHFHGDVRNGYATCLGATVRKNEARRYDAVFLETHWDLVINLKVAKELGLEMPPGLSHKLTE